MTINYLTGSVTEPQIDDGMRFVAHCCNNKGKWGSGVVVAISRRWGMPELMYKKWFDERPDDLKSALGKIQVMPVEKDIMVVNIIGQDGVGKNKNGKPPIRYEALKSGLEKTQQIMENYVKKMPTLHVPRIGAARAGGEWSKIEQIILDTISFPVYVYTLKNDKSWNK